MIPRRPADDVASIFDEVASEYDRTGAEFFGPIGERVVGLTRLTEGESVLDVGSGRGAVLLPAARAVGPTGHATGIDASPNMVRALADDVRGLGLRHVHVTVMDALSPDLPGGSFDAVTGSMSVHLFGDTAAAFRSYARLLRHEGRLCVCAPVSVDQPVAEVFGLASIARMTAAHGAGRGSYPYSEAFGGVAQARKDLAAAGFGEVEVLKEQAFLTAPTAESLLRWTRSHGMRLLWARVPDDQTRAWEERITEEARARSTDPSQIRLPVPVMYLLARRTAVWSTSERF